MRNSTICDITCNSIIDHPMHIKMQSFDVYTIFRFITSKKNKHTVFSLRPIDKDKYIYHLENKELIDFVKRINPFYNWKDEEKNRFYIFNFIDAGILQKKINDILIARKQPDSFVIHNPENSKNMTYESLDIAVTDYKTQGNDIYFSSLSEALELVEKYLLVYVLLNIPKSLEIHTLNMNKQIIAKKEFCSTMEKSDDF